MVFKISKINHSKLDEVYEISMAELESFFEIKWNYSRPNMTLVDDRKTINLLRGEKTGNWLIGWARNTDIYLLSDKTFEKESNHKYSDEEYFALIKHELAHCFTNIITWSTNKPLWLLDGISAFLSGQTKLKTKPKRLTKFIEFYKKCGAGLYEESGFAVEFLVKTYGKEKLLELLKRLKEANSKEEFANLFKSIYGFELSYENFKIL